MLNLKNVKQKMFPAIVAVSTAFFLITLTLVNGFVGISENYKTDDIKLREVEIFPEYVFENNDEILSTISNFQYVERTSQKFFVSMNKNFDVQIGEQTIHCYPYITGRNRNFSFCTKSEALEKKGDAENDPILAGRMFNGTDKKKALIDENTCYILGVRDFSEIIGTKISIVLSDISIDDIEIVGVFSKEYGLYYTDYSKVTEDGIESKLNSDIMEPLFYSDDIMEEVSESKDFEMGLYEAAVFCIDNTDHVGLICKKAMDMFGYANLSMVAAIETKAQNIKNACLFIYLISATILLAALTGMINSLYIKMDKQKKFTEMIIKIGFRKKQICGAYILENLIILAKAEIKAIIAVWVIGLGIDVFMSQGYESIVNGKKYLFLPKMGEVFGFVGLTFLVLILMVTIVSNIQVGRVAAGIEKA